jgi:hypothetical protein
MGLPDVTALAPTGLADRTLLARVRCADAGTALGREGYDTERHFAGERWKVSIEIRSLPKPSDRPERPVGRSADVTGPTAEPRREEV